VSYGILSGVFYGWNSILSIALKPIGYSQSLSGCLGMAMTVIAVVGGVGLGKIGDITHRLRLIILVVVVAATLLYILFTALADSLERGDTAIILSFIFGSLAGGLIGSIPPLFYELGVETTYPVSEEVSGAMIGLSMNLSLGIFLLVSPLCSALAMNLILTLGCGLVCILMFMFKEEHRRRNVDALMNGEYAALASSQSDVDVEDVLKPQHQPSL